MTDVLRGLASVDDAGLAIVRKHVGMDFTSVSVSSEESQDVSYRWSLDRSSVLANEVS